MSVSEMRSDTGLFGPYAGIPKHYDEVFAAPGNLRPHWRRFVELTGALGIEEYERQGLITPGGKAPAKPPVNNETPHEDE